VALANLALSRRRGVLVLAAVFVAAMTPWVAGVVSALGSGGFYAPGDEATRAEDLLNHEFPAGPANVVLVVSTAQGVDDPAAVAAGTALTARLAGEPGVSGVASYWAAGREPRLRTRAGDACLVVFRLTGDEEVVQRRIRVLHDRYGGARDGLTVRFGGEPAVQREIALQSREDLARAELVAAPLVFVVLVIAFGGVVAALLPLVTGTLSVIGTVALLRLLGQVTDVSVFSLNLATALSFGLAVDYGLLLVSRFREEQRHGVPSAEALRRTLDSAGRTVLFSGVTVGLSLAATLVFPRYYLRSFGYAGLGVVLASEISALVVLPALLVVLGRWLDRGDLRRLWRRSRSRRGARGEPRSVWGWVATAVMRRPWLAAGGVVLVLLLLAAPFRQANLSLADDRVLPPDSEAHAVATVLRRSVAECLTCTISVVTRTDGVLPAGLAALDGYGAALSAVPGVARVDTVSGSYAAGRRVAVPPDAARYANPAGRVWLSVLPQHSEPFSDAGVRLVDRLRAVPAPEPALVGGLAAHLRDTRHTVGRLVWPAVGLVLLASFVMLFLFVGSVVVPVEALVLSALSLTASFGAMVFVFQQGHLAALLGEFQVAGMLELTTPLLMFCIAFGLSMDYQVFLLSRVREDYLRTGDNSGAVVRGLTRTGPLITSAAAAVAVVLLALSTSQITILKMLGAGLALAVVVDVTLVRGILAPAFMQLAGVANWWAPAPLRGLHRRIGLREGDHGPAALPAERIEAFAGPAEPVARPEGEP
jgi:RND superfamily putative drug exporter